MSIKSFPCSLALLCIIWYTIPIWLPFYFLFKEKLIKEQSSRMAEAGLGMTATKGCVCSVVKHVPKGAPVVAQRCKWLFYEACFINRKVILLLGCCQPFSMFFSFSNSRYCYLCCIGSVSSVLINNDKLMYCFPKA